MSSYNTVLLIAYTESKDHGRTYFFQGFYTSRTDEAISEENERYFFAGHCKGGAIAAARRYCEGLTGCSRSKLKLLLDDIERKL